ncbi:MAG: GNAT family N-acetyltransferase [Pseudomonadota bacterium]
MSLRKPELSDASSMAAISIEVWLGTYLKRGVSAFFADYALTEFTAAKMEKLISDPEQVIRVSENQEGIDGFMRLSPNSPAPEPIASDVEISTLYVQPRHHGKGIGARLLSAALSQAKEMGAGSVWVATNAENTPAIAFYLAQGLEHAGETEFRIDDQAYLNNVYLYRFD